MKIEGGVTITLNHGGSASVSYKGNGRTVSGSGYYGRAAVIAEDTIKAAKAKERGQDFDPGTAKGMVSRPRGRRPGGTGKRFDPKKQAEDAGGEWATAKGLTPGDEVLDRGKWKKVKEVKHVPYSGFDLTFEDGTKRSGGSSTKYGMKTQRGEAAKKAKAEGKEVFDKDTTLQPGDRLLHRPHEDPKDAGEASIFVGYDDKGKMIFEHPGQRGKKTANQNRSSGRTRLTPKSPQIAGRLIQRSGKAQESAPAGSFFGRA